MFVALMGLQYYFSWWDDNVLTSKGWDICLFLVSAVAYSLKLLLALMVV